MNLWQLFGSAFPDRGVPVGGEKTTDGTFVPVKINAAGQLEVAVTGAGSGGTSAVDEAAFTPGTTAGTPAMGAYQATPSTLTDGQLGIVALDENRNVCVNVKAGGGGGGGGAVTVADGADVAQGATTDAAVDTDTTGTVSGKLRGLIKLFLARVPALGQTTMAGSVPVTLASNQSTVPVSAASLPLPTGAATDANQATQITAEQAIQAVLGATSDAADQAGTTSTANAKLRGLIQILADVWDSVNNRLDVFITNTSIAVTQSGSWVLSAGSALVGKVTIRNSADSADIDPLAESTFTGRIGEVQASPTANTVLARLKDLLTGIVLASGTNVIGALGAAASGGWTPYKALSAASTNSTNVKGSAGQIGYIHVVNTNAAIRYLKLYNKATAPTVGTDTPVHTFGIPGNTAGAGFTLTVPPGIAFGTGIGFGLTTGPTDADTGAVAANEITVNLGYK